jgi:hypothetical protein
MPDGSLWSNRAVSVCQKINPKVATGLATNATAYISILIENLNTLH